MKVDCELLQQKFSQDQDHGRPSPKFDRHFEDCADCRAFGAAAGMAANHLRAMRLLSPGGYLVTCSCSYNVSEEMFGDILHEASIDSRVPVTVVEKRMQGRDHPVLLGVPETYYLKCFILRRVE